MGCGNALPSCDLSAIAPWTTTTGCPSTSEDLVHTCTQYNVLRIHTLFAAHTMGNTPFKHGSYSTAVIAQILPQNLHLSSGTSHPQGLAYYILYCLYAMSSIFKEPIPQLQ